MDMVSNQYTLQIVKLKVFVCKILWQLPDAVFFPMLMSNED